MIPSLVNGEIGHSKLVEPELSKIIRAPVISMVYFHNQIKSNFLNLRLENQVYYTFDDW